MFTIDSTQTVKVGFLGNSYVVAQGSTVNQIYFVAKFPCVPSTFHSKVTRKSHQKIPMIASQKHQNSEKRNRASMKEIVYPFGRHSVSNAN